jgi:hypothetical protein
VGAASIFIPVLLDGYRLLLPLAGPVAVRLSGLYSKVNKKDIRNNLLQWTFPQGYFLGQAKVYPTGKIFPVGMTVQKSVAQMHSKMGEHCASLFPWCGSIVQAAGDSAEKLLVFFKAVGRCHQDQRQYFTPLIGKNM